MTKLVPENTELLYYTFIPKCINKISLTSFGTSYIVIGLFSSLEHSK